MRLHSRIEKLEAGGGDDTDEAAWRKRWQEAYQEIALTMDAHELAEVHAEVKAFLEKTNSGELNYWSSGSVMSFVASRVFSLVHRAANGFNVGLLMPPALSAAWREHDERHKDSPDDERHKAGFESHQCVDCKAEHPWLGRYELSAAQRRYVIVNPEEIITTCLLCGGVVGKPYGRGIVSASELAQ